MFSFVNQVFISVLLLCSLYWFLRVLFKISRLNNINYFKSSAFLHNFFIYFPKTLQQEFPRAKLDPPCHIDYLVQYVCCERLFEIFNLYNLL